MVETETLLAPETRVSHAFETIESERIAEDARRLLENVHAQARAADEKVRALFTANTIFVAALVVGSSSSLIQLSSGGMTLVGIIDLVLRGLLLLALGISLVASVMGLLPRLEIEEPDRSLFFFGHIAGMRQTEFVSQFMGMTFEERARQLLTQVHINSQIVQVKFRWIQRSARFLLTAVVLWLLSLGFYYLS